MLDIKSQAGLSLPAQAQLYFRGMSIGQRIKAAMIANDITQDVVGASLGVSKQAVSGWWRGKYVPKGERLARLAAVIGAMVPASSGSPEDRK